MNMRFLATSAILIAVWYILSGRFDVLHFGTGLVTALVIAAGFTGWPDRTRFRIGSFFVFIPWLAWQIILSNLRVARMVLSPRMGIAPTFIIQRPGVAGERALTTLGSGVTLTPGTLTVEVSGDELFVHALDTKSAADVQANVMANRIAGVFEETAA
jgi:multicomponent Na+:H+ antiporter subunit E